MKDNIDKIIEKIVNSAKNVVMTTEEKSRIRTNLVFFIDSKPANSHSQFYKREKLFSLFSLKHIYVVSFAFLFVFAFGISTSQVAKESLPGDTLYPVKIHLNENLESLTAISSEASANIEAEHATIRLKEAEALELKGKLTPQNNTLIKERFSKEVDSMNKHIKDIEKKGNLDSVNKVNKIFNRGVNNYYKAFITISGDSTTTEPFSSIIDSIKNKKNRETNKHSKNTKEESEDQKNKNRNM